MSQALKPLMQALGHAFDNLTLLQQALTHRSFSSQHNERLEFLGDSILGFIISSELYRLHPQAKEGSLSRIRSLLVNKETLAKLSHDKKITAYLRLGPGEKKNEVALSDTMLADTMEAIIGAIYLDSNIENCRHCVINWYQQTIGDIATLTPIKDAKTALQERLQAKNKALPQYTISEHGQKNSPCFTAICTVNGLPYRGKGMANSRRKAEQIAASNYLEQLNEKK